MKCEVGDKVRVRKDLEVGNMYGGYTFVNSMNELKGKELTIRKLYPSSYELIEDKRGYLWTDEMLEPTKPSLLDVINFMHPNLDLKEGEEFKVEGYRSKYSVRGNKIYYYFNDHWGESCIPLVDLLERVLEKIEKKYYLKAKDWRVVGQMEEKSYLSTLKNTQKVCWGDNHDSGGFIAKYTLKQIKELKKENEMFKVRAEFCDLVEVENEG